MADTKASTIKSTPTPVPTFQRIEGFTHRYANNVRYEATVHDLKLIFGESDLEAGPEVIKQHTAITIPWSVAKLTRYYLGINVLFHELYVSKIKVASNQIPLPFPEPTKDAAAADPITLKAHELGTRLRDEFLQDN